MATSPEHELLVQLQDLIIGTESVADFLSSLAGVAAAMISRSAGTPVECGVTLKRHRAAVTVGGSSDRAIDLDRIEHHAGPGPCTEAMRTKSVVLLGDTRSDSRWPEYRNQLMDHGCFTTLGVPLDLNEDASAALNFFASSAGVFSDATVRDAAGFAEIAGHAVRLAVKVATIQGVAQDMETAMKSRTAIDLACGIVIAQNRCTHAEAMKILTKASSSRNQKLRELAEEIVVKASGEKPQTHFDPAQAKPPHVPNTN
ncbi:GAF and ANTAR domain-containing protein [Pseudarthrobacter oxydans]|uniref:GAF and ANTAR domain-containing protein n=1 Tax=Pseudarthrobacter oxydans TaxID=1671 RepID=UPI003D2E59DF